MVGITTDPKLCSKKIASRKLLSAGTELKTSLVRKSLLELNSRKRAEHFSALEFGEVSGIPHVHVLLNPANGVSAETILFETQCWMKRRKVRLCRDWGIDCTEYLYKRKAIDYALENASKEDSLPDNRLRRFSASQGLFKRKTKRRKSRTQQRRERSTHHTAEQQRCGTQTIIQTITRKYDNDYVSAEKSIPTDFTFALLQIGKLHLLARADNSSQFVLTEELAAALLANQESQQRRALKYQTWADVPRVVRAAVSKLCELLNLPETSYSHSRALESTAVQDKSPAAQQIAT